MVAALEGDDVGATSVHARHFDSRFNSLCPAVPKKKTGVAAHCRRDLGQQLVNKVIPASPVSFDTQKRY